MHFLFSFLPFFIFYNIIKKQAQTHIFYYIFSSFVFFFLFLFFLFFFFFIFLPFYIHNTHYTKLH